MSATRSRAEESRYQRHLKASHDKPCNFCNPKLDEVLSQTDNFMILQNIYGYSVWDGQRVLDHLLVVPRSHIDSLGQFSPQMWDHFHDLIAAYEQKGYSIYARAPLSTAKSVVHQHTHLIRTDGRPIKLILWNRKPFSRFVA